MQQSTRRYIRVTQLPGCARKRARIRQYMCDNAGTLPFLLATDAVPTLLHLSVFLFFAGFLILLRHISHTVFNVVAVWVASCVVVYAYITFLPIYHPVSPRYAPISSLAYHVYANVLYPAFKSLSSINRGIRNTDVRRHAAHLLERLEKKAEEIVLEKSPKLDAKILESLLDTLGRDSEREMFFEAIPGFYDSQEVHVNDVKKNLSECRTFFDNFRRTVHQFLDQTLSSSSVSELVRCRRLLACLNATHRVLGDVEDTSITNQIICSRNWTEMPPSPEIAHILIGRRHSSDSWIALIGSCIIARILVSVESYHDTWMALARSQLEVTEEVFKGYLENENSVSLANLIKTTRLLFEEGLHFQGILPFISGFNVKEAHPELQHDFCNLWNEIVKKSKHSGYCIFILNEICHVHEALHHTAPTAITALPTSTTANNGGLLIRPSFSLCANPPSYHPPNASRQVAAVATSSSLSPLTIHPPSPALQRDGTNTNPHLAFDTPSSLDPLSPLHELPVEIQAHAPPALGHSYSATTSHTLATPREVSILGPDIVVVADAGERDVQDMNAHSPHQSDPPARDFSMGTTRPGKG
jgi:hypothetical protein